VAAAQTAPMSRDALPSVVAGREHAHDASITNMTLLAHAFSVRQTGARNAAPRDKTYNDNPLINTMTTDDTLVTSATRSVDNRVF
jgi:hypothetical protein